LIVGWCGQFLDIGCVKLKHCHIFSLGGVGRGRKLIGRNPIVGWCGRFLFFVVPRKFSQVFGEWPENQILIPDWTYFHCPGATLSKLFWALVATKIMRKKEGKKETVGWKSGFSVSLN